MNRTKWTTLIVVGAVSVSMAVTGCAKEEMPAEESAPPVLAEVPELEADVPEVARAVARLEQGADMVESGSVVFSKEGDGVRVTAHIVEAPPGIHGLHIHEIGDCSSEDYKSAGGHFNPADVAHGGPDDAEHHAGDLGNITIGEDGTGHLELVSAVISLGDDDNSVVGRGVILHQKADDLVSQPSGDAGARIACGVVVPDDGD